MSKSNSRAPVEKFHFPNSHTLWHDSAARPRSLGCQQCPYLGSCGGLNVGSGVFDCRTYCRCADPATCDNVCPNNPEHMVARSMEVRGFDLSNVPDAPATSSLALPTVVPMIFHRSARRRAPAASTVCLSLYEMFSKKDGAVRFSTRQALLDRYKLDDDATIILSGTDDDRALERWWRLEHRKALLSALRQLGVRLITTPNFSLFDDVPRHDNLYNMKRIALAWSEIQQAGLAGALHLNARTDRDWDHWINFLKTHPEIEYVAFEFATGAGSKSRIGWHVEKITRLADRLGRPLHLLARWGLGEVGALSAAFAGLTVIDTNAFMRAQKRLRASVRDGKLQWTRHPTAQGSPIDDLFDENIAALERYAALNLSHLGTQDAVNAVRALA